MPRRHRDRGPEQTTLPFPDLPPAAPPDRAPPHHLAAAVERLVADLRATAAARREIALRRLAARRERRSRGSGS